MYEIGREPVSLTLICHYNLFNFSSFHILIFVWTGLNQLFYIHVHAYSIYMLYIFVLTFESYSLPKGSIYPSIYLQLRNFMPYLKENFEVIYLSILLSIYQPIFLSTYIYILYLHILSIFSSGIFIPYLSILLSIYQPVYLSTYIYIYVFIYLYI